MILAYPTLILGMICITGGMQYRYCKLCESFRNLRLLCVGCYAQSAVPPHFIISFKVPHVILNTLQSHNRRVLTALKGNTVTLAHPDTLVYSTDTAENDKIYSIHLTSTAYLARVMYSACAAVPRLPCKLLYSLYSGTGPPQHQLVRFRLQLLELYRR